MENPITPETAAAKAAALASNREAAAAAEEARARYRDFTAALTPSQHEWDDGGVEFWWDPGAKVAAAWYLRAAQEANRAHREAVEALKAADKAAQDEWDRLNPDWFLNLCREAGE